MTKANHRDQTPRPAVARFSATAPYRPHRRRLHLSTPLLVIISALLVLAAVLANGLARSRDWQGLGEVSSRLSETDLIQRAAQAKQTAQRAESCLREAKRAAGIRPADSLSVNDSAWLGEELTPLVTTLGSLEAKRSAANPDWARVLTLQLYQAGVRPGSVVAAGCSGSFPSLNLALAAACQVLDAELVAVSSVTASTWGANQPGFTWPQIESRLVRAGIIRPVSAAVSLGGEGDQALDLDPSARPLALRIQQSSAAALGVSALSPLSLPDAVEKRLEIYRRYARGRRIVLYVNVGGTEASLGASAASFRLASGFIAAKPFDLSPSRGVIARFAEDGVPTLSLLYVEGLALRWGLKP